LFLPSKWNLNPKYHFRPKNDSEKLSIEKYFEIPPCGKIDEFAILGTFM
jgi:hypothetical protein